LMQQARATSLGQMNERGLINSSMAITAGNKAVYDAAMPIAQADAATYQDTAKTNNQYANQFATANNLQIYDLQRMAASQGYDLEKMSAEQINEMARVDAQTLATANRDQVAIQADANRATALAATAAAAAALNVTNAATVAAKLVDTNAEAALLAIQNDKIVQGSTNGLNAGTRYSEAIAAINAGTGDAASKDADYATAWNEYQSSISLIRAVYGLPSEFVEMVNFG